MMFGINACEGCTHCETCARKLCLDTVGTRCDHGHAICEDCFPVGCEQCVSIELRDAEDEAYGEWLRLGMIA